MNSKNQLHSLDQLPSFLYSHRVDNFAMKQMFFQLQLLPIEGNPEATQIILSYTNRNFNKPKTIVKVYFLIPIIKLDQIMFFSLDKKFDIYNLI